MALGGCEIIGNGSGIRIIMQAQPHAWSLSEAPPAGCGGVYLYANQRGCDEVVSILMVVLLLLGMKLLAQALNFRSPRSNHYTTVDLDEVRSFRGSVSSMQQQASNILSRPVHRITVSKW